MSSKESQICNQHLCFLLSENAFNNDLERSRNVMSWPAKSKSRLPTASKMRDASGENGNSHTGSLITAQTCLQPKQDQNKSDSNATLQPHNHIFILHTMKPSPSKTASRKTLENMYMVHRYWAGTPSRPST